MVHSDSTPASSDWHFGKIQTLLIFIINLVLFNLNPRYFLNIEYFCHKVLLAVANYHFFLFREGFYIVI